MSIGKLEEILQVCEQIQDSNLDDEQKYDLIFSENVSRQVFSLCRDMGLSLDYYDPDTTYEEDVRAFVQALQDYVLDYNQRKSSDNIQEDEEFSYYSSLVQKLK